MRKKIEGLARGEFESTRPILQFSTEKVVIEVLEGKDYFGEFSFSSSNHIPLRGIVYSSLARMECLNSHFEGETVKIRYQFHSQGLTEGDILTGAFSVVSCGGEYNLSFAVSISSLSVESSIGQLTNLSDFSRLARENLEEAYHLFYSQGFRKLLGENEEQERLIYEGLCKGGTASGQKVEEFLIAAEKKPAVLYSLEKEEECFYGVDAMQSHTLELKRNHWGYASFQVHSDADFLIPEKKVITYHDFFGNTCNVNYYINSEALHAGNNYGRLYFNYPGGVLTLSVLATANLKPRLAVKPVHIRVLEKKLELMQLYLDYRLKKIVTGTWSKQSVEVLNHLIALAPEEMIFPLLKAHTFIVNKQKQEAIWILEDFRKIWTDETHPLWAYYMYLWIQIEREETTVSKFTGEIEGIILNHEEDSFLFWIWLQISDEYYKDSLSRLKALEGWVMNRRVSPVFYVDAYVLLQQDPYLLTKLGPFETGILNMARKQKAITIDIALQVLMIIPDKKEYSNYIFYILCACYEVYPKDDMLAAICAYLMKGQQMTPEAHKWYTLGIEHELRLTGLCEAYLMSMDKRQLTPVPRMIHMYFGFSSSVPYVQKANLFVNMIAEKKNQADLYRRYRSSMEEFALEQMEEGHIDDNLAVIYHEILQDSLLDATRSEQFSKILFTHRLTCMNQQIVRAIILHQQLQLTQIVAIQNHVAYFQAYTNEYCVILEDAYGNRFVNSILYQDDLLLNSRKYLEHCRKMAPGELRYILAYLCEKEDKGEYSPEDMALIPPVLQSDTVSGRYKAKMSARMIEFYKMSPAKQNWEQDLLEIDYGCLMTKSRRNLVELLVEAEMLEKAVHMVREYGYENLSMSASVTLCSYMITSAGYEEDDFLTGFAKMVFLKCRYSEMILIYLCKFYLGPTREMARLWHTAHALKIDTFDLEERILSQMLYSTEYIEYAQDIYSNYEKNNGDFQLSLAYLSYFSQLYLAENRVVSQDIFRRIQTLLEEKKQMNDVCCLAELKWLSQVSEKTKNQEQLVDALLDFAMEKEYQFAFFEKFPESVKNQYNLNDKKILEYHTKPQTYVTISYTMDGEHYIEENMPESYPGVFTSEFLLFYGQYLQYYITEKVRDEETITESGVLAAFDDWKKMGGAFGMLNQMCYLQKQKETARLEALLDSYETMKTMTEDLFTLQ